MLTFPFHLPVHPAFQLILIGLWLLYVALYWRALVWILRASKFDSQDKILWFLVITLAPLIGLITFHTMCPPHILNPAPASPPPSD